MVKKNINKINEETEEGLRRSDEDGRPASEGGREGKRSRPNQFP